MCCCNPSQSVTAGKGESRAWVGSDSATAPGDLYPVIRMARGVKPAPLLAFHGGLLLSAVCCSLMEIGEEALRWSGIPEGDPTARGCTRELISCWAEHVLPNIHTEPGAVGTVFSHSNLHRSFSWCPEAAGVLKAEALPPENYSSIF